MSLSNEIPMRTIEAKVDTIVSLTAFVVAKTNNMEQLLTDIQLKISGSKVRDISHNTVTKKEYKNGKSN
ncbi:MAG: hypothetical protein GY804_09470 [Alphaproteobacteria bacterium]|nr:hypothetical protein [Alphaproteobacteria bacterium]